MLDQAGLVKTCPFSLKTCELMYERAVAGQMGTRGTRGGFGPAGSCGDGSSAALAALTPSSSTSAPRLERSQPSGSLEKLAGRSQKMQLWLFFESELCLGWVFFFLCLFESEFSFLSLFFFFKRA